MTIHNPAIRGTTILGPTIHGLTIQGPTIHAHMIRGRIARKVLTTIQERTTTMERRIAMEAFGIDTEIS